MEKEEINIKEKCIPFVWIFSFSHQNKNKAEKKLYNSAAYIETLSKAVESKCWNGRVRGILKGIDFLSMRSNANITVSILYTQHIWNVMY